MTTPSTPRKAGPLLGTGAQTSWPFTFKVFATSDIAVTIANNLGVETALVLNSDYSVTLNSNQDTSPGGTVTYPISGSALPTGSKLTIIGNLPYDQPLDLPSGGNFSPLALENQLDRLTMQIQQLREQVGRSLTVPVTSGVSPSLPSPAASNIIGWNENGDNLENYPLSELATSLAFATYRYDTFTGDGSTTQFTLSADPVTLGNLDVAVGGVTQTPGADYLLVAGVIEFTSAPPLGATILARFGEGIASGPSMDSYDVRFRPAGTEAVDRTAEAKMRETVSVKDFGATGDGTTDDTTAVQEALDSGALEVVFPAGGTYIVNGGLVSNQAGQVIRAYGATIKLKGNASTKGMLRLNGVGSSVMGGTWDGNKANGNGTTGSYPADLYTSWGIFIFADRCTVRDCYSINTYGMFCNGGTVSDTLFENNTIRNTEGYGLFLSTGSVNSYRNRAIGNNIDMSEGGVFGQGILFTGSGGTVAVKQFDWEISNNTVIGSQDAAMADQGINLAVRGSRGIVSNNITRYGSMGWSEGGVDTVITGNSFLDLVGSVRYGIEISGKNTTVSGNVVSNAINGVIISGPSGDFDNLCITGNRIQSTRDGIRLQAGTGTSAKNISITGNNITTALRGVITTGDIANLTIASNVIVGPGSGTSGSRGVYLENPPADAYVSVQGNTIASFQRACGVFASSALVVNKLYATGNNISNDTGSSSRAWNFEGSATMGTDVIFAWGPTNAGLRENRLDGNILFNIGTGSPEGGLTANVGSLFLRSNGGANTTLYIKESGTGNTGWVAK